MFHQLCCALYKSILELSIHDCPNFEKRRLDLGQDGIGTRDSDLGWRLFVLSIADSAILLNDHSPATVTVTHASGPTVVLGEEALGVGKHQDVVAGNVVDLAPSTHDPGVVGGDDGDNVDTLCLQLVDLLDVGREVVGLAAGGEGAWREEGMLVSDLVRDGKRFF